MNNEIIINSYKNKIFEIHGYPNFDIYNKNSPLFIFMSMPSVQDIILNLLMIKLQKQM